MTSRYVAAIDYAISQCASPIDCARLEARKAIFLARQGERTACLSIATRLRAQFASRPDVVVSASLHLVDGLLEFFSDLSPQAVEKFRRAYALAAAARATSVQALAAAWWAHMDFSMHRFEGMGTNLTHAFEAAGASDHDALSRSALVCAVALHLGGDMKSAMYWYRAARMHGLESGDDATTSAYMHNMVAMALMNLRQTVLSGVGDGNNEFDLMLAAESASNYDEMVGAVSLDKLLPVLQASILSLRGDAARGLALYVANVADARREGLERMAPWLLADMASCHLRLGEPQVAGRLASEAATLLDSTLEVQGDDAAAAHSRLAEVYSSLGAQDLSREHARKASDGWAQFRVDQAKLLVVATNVSVRFRDRVLPNSRSEQTHA